MTTDQAFIERAEGRGYRIRDEDGWREVSVLRGGKLYGMEINSTVDPSPDRWDAVLDHWDELLLGRMPAPVKR